MSIRILNVKQVKEKTSLSVPTIWRKERVGDFPTRRRISANRVGWVEAEIDAWLEQRVRGIALPAGSSK